MNKLTALLIVSVLIISTLLWLLVIDSYENAPVDELQTVVAKDYYGQLDTLLIYSYHTEHYNPDGVHYQTDYDSIAYPNIPCDAWDSNTDDGHRCIVLVTYE